MSSCVAMHDGADLDTVAARERLEALQAAWPARWAVCRDAQAPFTVIAVAFGSEGREESRLTEAEAEQQQVLAALAWLRMPLARVLVLTRSSVAAARVDRWLGWLAAGGLDCSHARRRLRIEAIGVPPGPRVIARARTIERVAAWIGDRERAFVVPGQSLRAAAMVALTLGLPLFGAGPRHFALNGPGAARALFREAGVQQPIGDAGVRSFDEIVGALTKLRMDRPALRRVRVRLEPNEEGETTAWIRLDDMPPSGDLAEPAALTRCVRAMRFSDRVSTLPSFLERLRRFGGVVEEQVGGAQVRSAWVALTCFPDAAVRLHASGERHEVRTPWGPTDATVSPADPSYAGLLNDEALKVGRALVSRGYVGAASVEFVVSRNPGGGWRPYAVRLRLQVPTAAVLGVMITGGRYDEETAGGLMTTHVVTVSRTDLERFAGG